MRRKMCSYAIKVFLSAMLLLAMAGVGLAQTQGAAAGGLAGQQLNAANAVNTANAIANSWGDSATIGANFNFGNPATTSTSKLPQQAKDAISVGETEAYLMALFALF